MKNHLRILQLEDNPADAELIKAQLEGEGFCVEVSRVQTEPDFVASLANDDLDLILADYSLPGFDGLSALALACRQRPQVPFIFISGTIGEDTAIETLKRGAIDYVLKQKLSRLAPAVRRALAEAQERSARRRSEEKITEQAALLDLAQDAIVVCNLAGRIQFWSKGAERLYGWSAGETSGREINELLHHEAASFQTAQKVVLDKGDWNGELQRQTKDGRTIIVHSRWTLLRDAQGNPKSFLSIDTDITDKKHLEAQFLRTQRIESVGRLASGIAHDLNNILAPIMISVPMFRLGLPPDEFEKILTTVEASAQRGADVIKQLLTYARGIEGNRAVLQLKPLLHEMSRMIQQTFPKNITFSSTAAPDLWPLVGDATQLHQVLMNLCVNARDAMPLGGALSVSAENFDLDENYVSMSPDATVGPHMVIRVTDTGKGIPPEIMEKIFDPFFSTKDPGKGSGLGLSTVLGIVRSHGAFLRVRSALGKGSTFEIYLPAAPDAEAQASPTARGPQPRGQGELILVVDDEASICEMTKRTLERNGYKVLTAADGVEALALYAQHPGIIDLVLTDIIMPILDGVVLVRALKKLDPCVKVIASSGISSSGGRLERAAELEALEVRAFLSKPYTAEKMLRLFEEMLHGPGSGPDLSQKVAA
jgi:two-component system cell cycle sensor histidine kinase/response regulator CckA